MFAYTFGAIAFVAMLFFVFGPALNELYQQVVKRSKARKKPGVHRGTPGL